MRQYLISALRNPQLAGLKEIVLVVRGLFFVGRRYRCPCCNWTLRGFVDRWGLLAANSDGYCPRCNAKARHRRIWLYLKEHSNLFTNELRLLEVAPWWSLARRFQKTPNLQFVGLDLERRGPHVTAVGDVTSMPFGADAFDAALCIHVLEHVEDDQRAIAELYRALKPGGWALVSVPLRLDRPTHEDPSITDPEERARVFGERGHVRFYGTDLVDRLEAAGFAVQLDLATGIPTETRSRFGLRDDENIFHCSKPLPTGPDPEEMRTVRTPNRRSM